MKLGKISLILLAIVFSLGPMTALATIDLGTAGTFGVLSSTFTANGGITAVTGDVGYTTLSGSGTITVTGGATSTPSPSQAGIDQGAALSALNALPCNFSFGSAQDLSLLAQPLAPGVYCITGAMSIGSTLTLSTDGTYVFRSTGALDTVANSSLVLGSASECNIFWTPVATTLGANSTFAGTVIDTAITVGSTVTWLGRALAYGGTVTTDTDIITAPTSCGTPPALPETATLTVIKEVLNTNGVGTATSSDFSLHVKLGGVDVTGSPADGVATPGTSYTLTVGSTYVVSEVANSSYVATFSGDCLSTGSVAITSGGNTCTITNVDIAAPVVVAPIVSSGGGGYYAPPIPPLIDIVKVPSPLALPAGPGPVNYTYTLRNIGKVPVTKITMVGDTCSPIVLASGDTNKDSKLDLTETWKYTCSTTLTKTHTNTVVATGWANGISATDIASATVVVGVSVVPPLIHVTKVPSPLALPAGGGMVTYTEKITNPGIVPLSNVKLTDDKCSPVSYISGDTNNDSKLDPTETWTYTCKTRLNQTTRNIATATGVANGLTVRDVAIATVVVAGFVPKLPNTGFPPASENLAWFFTVLGLLILASIVIYFVQKKKKT